MLPTLITLVFKYMHHMQCYMFFSLSLPDCCFTHTVKLVHGRARGRNTVHITCSTVCGCPDSSSGQPLRHPLLHDGELHASPAMQPASLPSLRRTSRFLKVKGSLWWVWPHASAAEWKENISEIDRVPALPIRSSFPPGMNIPFYRLTICLTFSWQ